jgi:hypothetical protein
VTLAILKLKDGTGKVVSSNYYWLSADNDFKPLNDMAKTDVQIKLLKTDKVGGDTRWTFQVTNPTGRIAFFVRSQLMLAGAEVLPSFWSDNYFTLAPSESTTITVSCPAVKTKSLKPELKISGWNVKSQMLLIN